eukprot:4088029-Prymnesium_polylepis.1
MRPPNLSAAALCSSTGERSKSIKTQIISRLHARPETLGCGAAPTSLTRSLMWTRRPSVIFLAVGEGQSTPWLRGWRCHIEAQTSRCMFTAFTF